ncbi:M23 family metallopeptidase [Streptomyces kebangsaanensis]|uniref:M23 family metallopeptidase n=1 Tax=Streptomyces kebangsaanensis TaxID=864058 RepID=UPI000939A5EC|nr:M23 family metallopeptidase [Streptomyces kebangsaanensis]
MKRSSPTVRSSRPLARAAARVVPAVLLTVAAVGLASPARAATYQVTGADSQGLAVQSEPHVNHVLRYVPNGTSLNVSCQINNGDQVDGKVYNGRPFTTWDQLADGTWVYDWYMNTPTVGADGYSPGIPHCGGGSLPPLAAGCVDWPSAKYLQTPLTSAANNRAGYAWQNGSHYGEGYHVSCNGPTRMNQYYAIDLGMNQGDPALSPGGAGTVLYAGWAPSGWETCGQYVVVDHGGGWWSVVCHLSAVHVSKGQRITNDTVIGAVGGTGGFAPHLHFSLVYNASLTAAGGVYGGQSARPRHLLHLGGGQGYYDTITKGQQVWY